MKLKATLFIFFFCLGCLLVFSAGAQNWLWGRGNTGSSLDGWAIAADPSGNVFVGGVNFGYKTAKFGANSIPFSGPGPYQCVVAKYSSSGSILWTRGIDNGSSWLINVAADAMGNFYLLGSFNSASVQVGTVTLTNPIAPEFQYFLAKYDAAGNVLWARNGGNTQAYGANLNGGTTYVLSTGGIATDASGNAYITCNFHTPSVSIGTYTIANTNTAASSDDILVAKYDPSGNMVWAKGMGGSKDDEAYGITVTPSGYVYIAGVFNSPSITFGPSVITNTGLTGSYQTAFIAKLDPSGNAVWAQGSGGTGLEYAIGVASDASGNVYMTGGLRDNSISYSGTTITNPYPGSTVLYLAKFDPSNNVSWYKTIGEAGTTIGRTWGYSIAMSACGVVWVSGVFYGSVNIDGHTLNVPGCSPDPIFIAGYNTSGTYVASAALQSGGDDQNGIACDAAGNVYMCSDYWGDMTSSDCPQGRFVVGNDTLAKDDSATELLFVSKFPSLNSTAYVFRHSDTSICLDGDLVLNAPQGYANYIWSSGKQGISYPVTDTGVIWASGFDSCASGFTDTFRITLCDCSTFFVPNTFTPNGDGENDVFYPRSSSNTGIIKSFRVYDRWGELVFERRNILPNDASNAWDGYYKNAPPRPEVYVWALEATCKSGKPFNMKGSVTIVK